MNDSAAACSMRTWFSSCSNKTSIGTREVGRTGGTDGNAAARSEKKRGWAAALTIGSWGCTAESDDFERVAAPKAATATASPNMLMHKTIKNISMATLLQGHLAHFFLIARGMPGLADV